MFQGFKSFDLEVAQDITIHGVHGGSGAALLLLHGFPQTHVIWHKVAPSLAQHYTLVAIDLRGYGASSKPAARGPNNHSLMAKSAMAKDCASVMQQLGHSKYFVCGHDRGGRVAHKLCVDFPDQVLKCMVLDICPTKAMYEKTDLAFAKAYWHWFFLIAPAPLPEHMILSADPEALVTRRVGGSEPSADFFGTEPLAAYKAQMKVPEGVHSMCEDYRASAKEDMQESTDDLAAGRRIKCPIKAVWGKQAVIEKLFDAKAEWSHVSENDMLDASSCALDCGHYIAEEAPDELVEHVRGFFR